MAVIQKPETLGNLIIQSAFIVDEIIENGGELSPELKAQFQDVNIAMEAKIDGYAHILDRLDVEAEYFRIKAAEFQRICSSIKAAKDILKERLVFHMKTMKTIEVFGGEFKFKLRKPVGRLEITDEMEIPDRYKEKVTVIQIDKAALKTDIMADASKVEPYEAISCEKIPGARIVMNPSLLKSINRKGPKDGKHAISSTDSRRRISGKNDEPVSGERKRKKTRA